LTTLARDETGATTPVSSEALVGTTQQQQPTAPVQLTDSLRLVMLALFSDRELEHLVSLRRSGSLTLVARRRLTDAKREELADMLIANRFPTIGWWRRAA
jgi:hypothetical protein